MSETAAEVETIRRRYAAVIGMSLDAVRDEPVEAMRWVLAGYDEQRAEYRAMGFEVDDPEADAAAGK